MSLMVESYPDILSAIQIIVQSRLHMLYLATLCDYPKLMLLVFELQSFKLSVVDDKLWSVYGITKNYCRRKIESIELDFNESIHVNYRRSLIYQWVFFQRESTRKRITN